jgi:hypothetical protein
MTTITSDDRTLGVIGLPTWARGAFAIARNRQPGTVGARIKAKDADSDG